MGAVISLRNDAASLYSADLKRRGIATAQAEAAGLWF